MNQPEVGPSRARPFTKEQRIQLSIDSGLSLSYESRIDTMYAVRLSQCRLHRSFTTVQVDILVVGFISSTPNLAKMSI